MRELEERFQEEYNGQKNKHEREVARLNKLIDDYTN